jgi:putative tryptophan/tyrosine transport system substrate-binding protein
MRRREFLASLAGASTLPIGAAAQQRRLPLLAMVHPSNRVEVMSRSPRLNEGNRAFLDELARLGYVEGETIRIDRWTAEGKAERFAALAQEVAQSRPDVIHTISARLTQHLKAASSEIPIVAMTADPVAWGLAASLARPGGNVTGVTADVGTELVTKHLELLRELTPTASRLGLLAPTALLDSVYARALRDAAQKVGVAIIPLPLESPINEAEYRRVFAAIPANQVHGVIVGDAPENFANRSLIFELMADYRLPAIYAAADYARSGGLLSYGTVFTDLMRRMAQFVDQILKGAKPSEMPFEQPTRLHLVINLKAAEKARIAIPPTLLARADEVIE